MAERPLSVSFNNETPPVDNRNRSNQSALNNSSETQHCVTGTDDTSNFPSKRYAAMRNSTANHTKMTNKMTDKMNDKTHDKINNNKMKAAPNSETHCVTGLDSTMTDNNKTKAMTDANTLLDSTWKQSKTASSTSIDPAYQPTANNTITNTTANNTTSTPPPPPPPLPPPEMANNNHNSNNNTNTTTNQSNTPTTKAPIATSTIWKQLRTASSTFTDPAYKPTTAKNTTANNNTTANYDAARYSYDAA
jgi:hypothetical protein